jgi:hypothetical protein
MVMPECQKFARTEVNRHSGETLALNVPADTFHTIFGPNIIIFSYKHVVIDRQFEVQRISQFLIQQQPSISSSSKRKSTVQSNMWNLTNSSEYLEGKFLQLSCSSNTELGSIQKIKENLEKLIPEI